MRIEKSFTKLSARSKNDNYLSAKENSNHGRTGAEIPDSEIRTTEGTPIMVLN